MSGSIVNTNGSSSITITNLISQLQGLRPGFDTTVLTNYSTQAKPAIAAGGYCECGGSLYLFSTQEEISTASITSTANMTYFVELVPSSSTITAQFSSTVPTFREDYGGFYLSTSSNHRIIAEMEKEGASTYYWYKNEFKYLNRKREKTTFITFVNSTTTGTQYQDHYISNLYSSRYRNFNTNFYSTIGIYLNSYVIARTIDIYPFLASTQLGLTIFSAIPLGEVCFEIKYI